MPAKIKTAVREVAGRRFRRVPIKTHIITAGDDIVDLVLKYSDGQRRSGDVIVLAESPVAITQGRAIGEKDIRVGPLARLLWRFVSKNPYGIGLRSPATMQCAINECGGLRILLAALVGAVSKLLGRKGDFYRIAGMQAALIDAAHTSPVPPYDQCVILGPKNPEQVARKVGEATGCEVAVMDINDIGGSWVIGATKGVDRKLLEEIMRDNPLGQSDELTPMGIVREE